MHVKTACHIAANRAAAHCLSEWGKLVKNVLVLDKEGCCDWLPLPYCPDFRKGLLRKAGSF